MKRTLAIIVSCCLFLCVSCKKENYTTHSYKASMEYFIADTANAHAVETLLKGYKSVWLSEINLTMLNTGTTDAEAHSKFETSIMAIDAKRNSWRSFFEEGDYMIYTLERTTPGREKVLRTIRFDADGHIVL
ncbi:MAG: hypothetical protein J5719_00265 [Bacteroidales bacterium]|nr:hypothetical protein [Bacteroidales bacterium]